MKLNQMKWEALAVTGTVGGVIITALGGPDIWLSALLWLMLADYITGLAIALIWKRSPKTETGAASSGEGLKGLVKKGVMLLVVLVAYRLDLAMGIAYLRNAVIMAFLANELLSMAENLGIMGVPWPSAMQNAIELLTQKGGEDHDAQRH